jgi:hypothetical protein
MASAIPKLGLAACVLALAAGAAQAQPAPTGAAAVAPPVTVPGSVRPGTIQDRARSFVEAYAAATPKIGQIPRWQDPPCVQVIGLPPDQAAQVKARVEEMARAVGLAAAPAQCATNVEIAFTAQPQQLVDSFIKGRESILGYYSRDPGAKTVTRPIQAWYVTATAGGAGSNAGWAFAFTGVPSQSGGNPTQMSAKVVDRPDSWSPTGCGDSVFTSCLRSQLENVFVVVDVGRAAGRSVGVLSDYVAMLVLSQPRALGGCQPLPSVTDLFVDGCAAGAANGVTAADAAYLTALYQANPEARKEAETTDIAGRMAKMLASSNVVAR